MAMIHVNNILIQNSAMTNLPNLTVVDCHHRTWINNSMYKAFENCSGIQQVVGMVDSVTNMSHTFANCSNIVSLADGIPQATIDMQSTFYSCCNLVDAPEIPNSVADMSYTFYSCSNLVNAPEIPNSVTNMYYTFHSCSNLVNAPIIPNSVADVDHTFENCSSLVNAPVIPNSVTTMDWTFSLCTNLVNAPIIPNSVTNMWSTFSYCQNLIGNIYIQSNQIINATQCFAVTTQTKNVYIPLTYSNGVNSATYNSFIDAGYSTTERKDGVLLMEIIPDVLYKWRRTDELSYLGQFGTLPEMSVHTEREESSDRTIDNEQFYFYRGTQHSALSRLIKSKIPAVGDPIYSVLGTLEGSNIESIDSVSDLYTTNLNPRAGDNVYTEDGQITGTITSIGDGYINVSGKYYYDATMTLTINPTPGDATVVLTAAGYTQEGNSISVPVDTVITYTVSREGYFPVTGSITMTKSLEQSVTLVPIRVYTFDTAGEFEGTLDAGTYTIKLSGAGGTGPQGGNFGASYIVAGGNAHLATQTIVVPDTLSFIGVVATAPGGYVNGTEGEKGMNGNVMMCKGGSGGGQSRFYMENIIDLRADGGGGAFAYSGTALNAKGGNGSAGALGGQSRSDMNGQNAGNGLGAKGAIKYGADVSPTGTMYTQPAEIGYCIIDRVQ